MQDIHTSITHRNKRRKQLDSLFAPHSIAVVGASASSTKLGFTMVRSLASFQGTLYPINPRESSIGGFTVYPRVIDIPEKIDLAILTVSANAVLKALEDCAIAGVQSVMICAGGFAESGSEGRSLQDRVVALIRETGMRVLGPNTSGYINPVAGVRASFVPAINTLRSGPLAIIAQSGGVNHALAFLAHNDGSGIRLGVGLGNAINVGFADVIDYLTDDPETRIIVLHIEGVAEGRALIEAIEQTSNHIPVVALKAGKADVGDFARSHTGTLIGNWTLTRAALRQAGAVVVDDTTELIDAARALVATRLTPKELPGVGVITSQAGPGLLITDMLRSSGVQVPELTLGTRQHLSELLPPLTLQSNPVDTGRPSESFGKVLAAVGADTQIDAIIAYALHEPTVLDPIAAMRTAHFTLSTMQHPVIPVIFATGGPLEDLTTAQTGLEALNVPTYTSPERGARAMRALVADARAMARLRHTSLQKNTIAPNVLDDSEKTSLDEDAAKTVLEAIGIRTPLRHACKSREQAHSALAYIRATTGRHVVVKILDTTTTHKSDVGGVHLGIETPNDLDAALDTIDKITLGRRTHYLIEEMLPSGLELIVGGTHDASFGPTVLLGFGGIFTEALSDVAVRLAPITPIDAAEMLDELQGRALLNGYRSQPRVDRAEVMRILLAVSQLMITYPKIAELDINPLRMTNDGLYALDALIILQQ